MPDRNELMHDATDRIELLVGTLTPILDTPGVPEILAAKAAHGCSIRILVYDTGPHLAPIVNEPAIEIRRLQEPAVYTLLRFDDELLLTLHMVAGDFEHMPLIHLRRAAPEGLFDRLAEYYNDLWEQDSKPINPDLARPPEEDEDEDENPHADLPLPVGDQPPTSHSARSAPPPRRWPRRPDGPPDHG